MRDVGIYDDFIRRMRRFQARRRRARCGAHR
jgi:hypothetical protein